VITLAKETQGAYTAKDFSGTVSRTRNESNVLSAIVGRMNAVRLKATAQ
jgi:hypothetical protein